MGRTIIGLAVAGLLIAGVCVLSAMTAAPAAAQQGLAQREAVTDRDLQRQERKVEAFQQYVELLEAAEELTFEPRYSALLAIGYVKDTMKLAPDDRTELLETILKDTRSIGLRNAIRLALKDLYERSDQTDRLRAILIQHIRENDEAILQEDRWDDGDDWDEEDDDD